MRIFAHRGLWKDKHPQNSVMSFVSAMDAGYDIELDVRDQGGRLVISHDLAMGSAPIANNVFSSLSAHSNFRNTFFAFDIKSSGLSYLLADLIARFDLWKQCFLFEGEFRELLRCKEEHKLPICAQISDLESFPQDRADYLWYVEFEKDWISDLNSIDRKPTILCSNEIVGKSIHRTHALLDQYPFWGVCTDYPDRFTR